MAWKMRGEMGDRPIENRVKLLFCLSQRATDGQCVPGELGHKLDSPLAQVGIGSPLKDTVEALMGIARCFQTTNGPTVSSLKRHLRILFPGKRRGAFVESEDEIGAQQTLQGDGALGCETVGRPVDVGSKGDSVVVDFSQGIP